MEFDEKETCPSFDVTTFLAVSCREAGNAMKELVKSGGRAGVMPPPTHGQVMSMCLLEHLNLGSTSVPLEQGSKSESLEQAAETGKG